MSRLPLLSRRSAPAEARPPTRDDFDRQNIAPAVERALRELLLRHSVTSPDGLPAIIAVTSVLPDPQVAAISRSLAVLLSEEHGATVCWFDSREVVTDDSRRLVATPSEHGRPGGRRSTDSLVHISRRLRALSIDAMSEDLARAPADGAVASRLRGLMRDHDHVVVLTAPPTPDTSRPSIVRHCDGYVLVVRQSSVTTVQTQLVIDATGESRNLGVLMTDYRSRVPRRWSTILDH